MPMAKKSNASMTLPSKTRVTIRCSALVTESMSIHNTDPSPNSGRANAGWRTVLSAVLVRTAWFCILLLCFTGLKAYSTFSDFPRPGASEPLTDVAAFNESAGIFIDRVTDGPFLWLHRFVSPAIAVWLPWVFWTTVLYMLSALLHRPRSVFRRSSSTQ